VHRALAKVLEMPIEPHPRHRRGHGGGLRAARTKRSRTRSSSEKMAMEGLIPLTPHSVTLYQVVWPPLFSFFSFVSFITRKELFSMYVGIVLTNLLVRSILVYRPYTPGQVITPPR